MKEKFAESVFLTGVPEKLGGAICLQVDLCCVLAWSHRLYLYFQYNKSSLSGEFLWTHTTASMGIGFQVWNGNSRDRILEIMFSPPMKRRRQWRCQDYQYPLSRYVRPLLWWFSEVTVSGNHHSGWSSSFPFSEWRIDPWNLDTVLFSHRLVIRIYLFSTLHLRYSLWYWNYLSEHQRSFHPKFLRVAFSFPRKIMKKIDHVEDHV